MYIGRGAMFCCTEAPVYSRLDVTVGDSVELLCNTSLTSDIMWTYDNDEPHVDYVYWKGIVRVGSDKPRLSVKTTGGNFHNLVIDDAELKDSGVYSCYDDKGSRKIGYHLVVNGTTFLYPTVQYGYLIRIQEVL